MNEVVLKVAAGRGHEIGKSVSLKFVSFVLVTVLIVIQTEDAFVSNIRAYTAKMKWD